MPKLIHVATIASPHGVRGDFKLRCFLESPKNIGKFSALYNESGDVAELTFISLKATQPIAHMKGVDDRNDVDTLRGMKLFAKEDDFPNAKSGEFYAHQLVGMSVNNSKGEAVGTTLAHHNFGAGDILEIEFNNGTTEMLPFDEHVFPDVDLDGGQITYMPPEWME